MDLHALEGAVLAGRFKLTRLLGRGGYGAVFEAEQLSVGRRCAIKLIYPGRNDDSALVERFRAEARRTSRLTDPHTVLIYDFGHDEDRRCLFLAMEYLEGEDLNARLTQQGPLPIPLVVDIVDQASQSLQEAHDLGMIHRDIKPGNIMLTRKSSGEDFVKVIDFGIAKSIQSSTMTFIELTEAGTMVGTPQYMSPEHILGHEMDGRTDQYALAITAYKMLTGRTPFEGGSTIDIATRQIHDSPLPPRAYRAELAEHLVIERVLLKALEKSPDDRYPTIREFGEAMQTALERPRERRALRGTLPVAVAIGSYRNESAATGPERSEESEVETRIMARDMVSRETGAEQTRKSRRSTIALPVLFGISATLALMTAMIGLVTMGKVGTESASAFESSPKEHEPDELEMIVSTLEPSVEEVQQERSAEVRPTGKVEVRLSSGGILYVGGVPFSGRSPQLVELPAGEHLFTLRLGDETLARKTVDVQAGSLTMVELLAH